MPRPKKPSASALARELHASNVARSHADIASEVSARLRRKVRPWEVARALASSGKPGPRTHRVDGERVVLTLDAAIVARARQEAEGSSYSLSEWVEGCLIAAVEDADARAETRAAIERMRAMATAAVVGQA